MPIRSKLVRRALLFGVPIVLIGGGALTWYSLDRLAHPPPQPHHDKPKRTGPLGPEPPILRVPVESMREFVAIDTLLRPDRRFVIAFEEVARRGGATKVAATVTPNARRWTIGVGLPKGAALPGIPGYVETMESLREVAQASPPLRGGKALSQGTFDRLQTLASDPTTDGPVRALREIDRLWAQGADRAGLLDLASRAFLSLEMQKVDSLELADVSAGRALGLLALSEAASGRKHPERHALLGYFLCYPNEARALAAALPPGGAARLFLEEDDAALKTLAETEGASPETRFLYLLRGAVKGKRAELTAWRERYLPRFVRPVVLHGFELRIGDESFRNQVPVSAALVVAAMAEVGAPRPSTTSQVLPAFERALAAMPASAGPFFDDEAARALHRAAFFTGLNGISSFYFDTLSSGPAAQEFASSLEGADPGIGEEYARFTTHAAAVKTGKMRVSKIVEDLETFPNLGQGVVRSLGLQIQETLYATAPGRLVAAEALTRLLDSRPENNSVYGTACLQDLFAPLAARDYYRASTERYQVKGGDGGAWMAQVTGDVGGLRAIAADVKKSPFARLEAMTYLVERSEIASDELRVQLTNVLTLTLEDDDYSAMRAVRLLWENGHYGPAETFLRRWLAAHPDEDVLGRALYASRLERVLFESGRFQEAHDAIEPYIGTGKADALTAGAEALEGLGRHQEALELARSAVERYPDGSGTRLEVAQLLWRQDRNEEAAKLLVDPRYPLPPGDWRAFVGRRFYEVFGKAKPAKTKKAFDALVKAGVNPWFLFDMAPYFARKKQYEIASDLLEAVCKSKGETIDGHLLQYRYRKLDKGEEHAAAWFRKRVASSKSAEWVADIAFDEREFDVLWLLKDDGDLWFLRAAGAAFEGGAQGPRREKLEARLKDPKASPDEVLYGRFLLGLEPAEKLLAAATDGPHRCDVAFLFGLKAAGEKRIADASDWFRVCLRTEQHGFPSYERALEILKRWDSRRFGVRGGADTP